MNNGVTGGHLTVPALSGRDACGREAESTAEDGTDDLGAAGVANRQRKVTVARDVRLAVATAGFFMQEAGADGSVVNSYLPPMRVNCPRRFTVSRAEQRDSIPGANLDQRRGQVRSTREFKVRADRFRWPQARS